MDAAEALLFLAFGRCASGLVVGHDELAVGVELEPVDDPADGGGAELGDSMSSRPIGAIRCGVLELKYRSTMTEASAKNARLVVGVDLERGELGEVRTSSNATSRSSWARVGRAGIRGFEEEQFERPVDGGALDGRERRGFREAIDGGEPEGQRAVLEGRHLRRRQRGGERQRHGPTLCIASDSHGDRSGSPGSRAAVSPNRPWTPGASSGPKCPSSGWSSSLPSGQGVDDQRGERRRPGAIDVPPDHDHRAGHLAEVLEGAVLHPIS